MHKLATQKHSMYKTTEPSCNIQSDIITYVAKVLNISAKNDLNNNELISATDLDGHAGDLTFTAETSAAD